MFKNRGLTAMLGTAVSGRSIIVLFCHHPACAATHRGENRPKQWRKADKRAAFQRETLAFLLKK